MSQITTGTPDLLATRDASIGWLTYNRPDKRNALSLEVQRAVPEALQHFTDDSSVRVIVLRGGGEEAFISGADIAEFSQQRATAEQRRGFDATFQKAWRALAQCPKPVLAMIHGYCLGGGLATALLADLRIASDDACFGIPAARLGLGYGFSGIKALVDRVGPAFASEILFTGSRFSAEVALRNGLVNRVVPKNDLETEVRKLAERIAANAPLTVRAAKATILEALRDPAERDLERCARLVEDCFESRDYVEGRRAFLEKRPPRFEGR